VTASTPPAEPHRPEPPRLPGGLDIAFLTNEPGACELVLVRHGQQALPDRRDLRVGDIVDPPLSAIGRRQAEHLGERFRHRRVDAVYSSHLSRAVDTGRAVAVHHGLEPEVYEDLREVEVFSDLPADRRAADVLGADYLAGIRDRMARERRWDIYPGTESSVAFRNRVINRIDAIAATNPGRRVVIACHGGVINAYLAELLGARQDMLFRPAHTAVNVFVAGEHGRRAVRSLGDVAHLEHDDELVTY
jgi:broad specificity phosphatase PhoE